MRVFLGLLGVGLTVIGLGRAIPAQERNAARPVPGTAAIPPETLKQISASLRASLVTLLPNPLHEKATDWGETEKTPSRIKWEGNGLKLRPKMVYTQKNDGTWKKVRVTADDAERNLHLEIKNVEAIGGDKTAFDVLVALKARVHYHQQNWQQGIKLWDATADARFRLKLMLRCEATTRLEGKGRLIPELVYRLRVTHADVSYDDFEVTHIAGVGGELAKLFGDAARKAIREFKPSLEERLLTKAEARILKAGDTKEIRLGGSSKLDSKKAAGMTKAQAPMTKE